MGKLIVTARQAPKALQKAPKRVQGVRMSPNAAAVGRAVVAKVATGGKVNLSKEIVKQGYSPRTARTPTKITKQPAYKAVVDPVINDLEKIRKRAIQEMLRAGRKLNKVDFKKLSEVVKNMTHDIQLLSGGQTENTGLAEHAASLEALRKEIILKKKNK